MGETVLGNRYEIIRKIGDGGMAFVYEAKDRLLNRTVAVKVLRPEFVDDEEFLGKFKREAEAVASLSHPNIVNVYDVGEDGKVHYIVMEFIDGQNLKEIIKNEGTLDEYTALDITKQIAMALSAAHKKGIIHRDIKPHNILISNEGRIVKVADFGIAKAVSNSTMTNIGSIIGSVHYFSPEQAKGKFVTNNADLYSLGIVLYEMLIGKVPFRGDSPISIALQHINDEIDFTPEEKVNIPQSVRTIIKKLTEKSTADRYQSAEELIEDIEYIEKNIDLDFIKEYDNYATQKIDEKEMSKISKSGVPLESEYDDEEDEDEDEGLTKKELKRRRKQERDESPKTRKRLKIAAVVLAIILITQVAFALKFAFGRKDNNGQISLEDFTGMHVNDVTDKIDKLGLKVVFRDGESSEFDKDHVISQTPVAGTNVEEGDTITIVLSKGSNSVDVPDVVGITLSEAQDLLEKNNLNLGTVFQEYSNKYKEGIVISQTPRYNASNVSEGTSVDVVISKGPEVIQNEPDDDDDDLPDNNTTVNPPSTNKPNNGNSNGSNNGNSNSNGSSNKPNNGNGSTSGGTGQGGNTTNPPESNNPGDGNETQNPSTPPSGDTSGDESTVGGENDTQSGE